MRAVVAPVVRAAIVVFATAAYLAFVFRLRDGQFRSLGLGDWIDPYFINGLLEHWYHVATTLGNPASPPTFHPAPHTLGYSHGLVLFAPFYVPLRLALHPFDAYTGAIFAAIAAGNVTLYAWLRRSGCSFVEALALSALFTTSANVINGPSGVWTQRVSVFLIPPIMLLASRSAFAAGLLAALLYVQDFYTAHFAMLIAAWFAAAALTVHHRDRILRYLAAVVDPRSRGARIALGVALVAAVSAVLIVVTGGADVRVLGVRLVARDWRRPALVAGLAAAILVRRDPRLLAPLAAAFRRPWLRAAVAGAAAGGGIFLWIYLPAFRQYPGFPAEEVWRALAERSPYLSFRPFLFAAALAGLTWVPVFRVDRPARHYALWLLAASLFVWLVPLRFGERSLWMDGIRHLPGFRAIRDPSRIIYLYEIAVVIAAALVLRRAPDRWFRRALVTAAVALVLFRPNGERFDYGRERAAFDRWVAAPIAIDPGCRSFFIKPASSAYGARSPHAPALYGVDAMFIATRHSLPALNGFSAWTPAHWDLANPHDSAYPARVQTWIARNALTAVCELDIDTRRIESRITAAGRLRPH